MNSQAMQLGYGYVSFRSGYIQMFLIFYGVTNNSKMFSIVRTAFRSQELRALAF